MSFIQTGEVAWPEAKTRFNKSHLVGAHIPSATRQRSQSATSLHHDKDFNWNKHFISPCSIPHSHVPRPILKRMLRFEYFGSSIPRYSSLSWESIVQLSYVVPRSLADKASPTRDLGWEQLSPTANSVRKGKVIVLFYNNLLVHAWVFQWNSQC